MIEASGRKFKSCLPSSKITIYIRATKYINVRTGRSNISEPEAHQIRPAIHVSIVLLSDSDATNANVKLDVCGQGACADDDESYERLIVIFLCGYVVIVMTWNYILGSFHSLK